MEQHATPTPSPAAPRAAFSETIHWTPDKQRLFLLALSETGNVVRAARAAGMSARSAYRLRIRLAGTGFDYSWERALTHAARMRANPFDPAFAPGPRPAATPASRPAEPR